MSGRSLVRIEDVVGLPEIGTRYRVPCVKVSGWRGRGGGWMPVIGPAHDDSEIIGLPYRHYHHDARFTPASMFGQVHRFDRRAVESVLLGVIRVSVIEAGPEHRVRVCQRQMPEFPLRISNRYGEVQESPFARKLEAAYADRRVDPKCMRCPHRGFPLDGLPVRDGVVVCPGHGLAWDVTTGRLVPREVGCDAEAVPGRSAAAQADLGAGARRVQRPARDVAEPAAGVADPSGGDREAAAAAAGTGQVNHREFVK